MQLFHSDVLCPYCLEELRKSDLLLECNRCGKTIKPTRGQLMLGKAIKCPEAGCFGIMTKKQCPVCNSTLPADIMDYEKYLRFSILGITGSGKTNFLTTMLHELRNAPNSDWILAPMDQLTTATYQENDQLVYENRQPVAATAAGTTPPPLLWRIKDRSRMTAKSIPSYSLTIFDGAGEDSEHIDPVISRYIDGSKALVILIDPLALPHIGKTINRNIYNWSTTATHGGGASTDMVDGLANYIRESCNIKANKLIDRDVAVVFTKIDAVADSFGQAQVMQASPHLARKGFVKADADAVDAEIRDWLESQGESAFIQAVETNFKPGRVRFFGVSSFGQPPTGPSQLGKVIPHRVLDPLMWVMSKENIVPTI